MNRRNVGLGLTVVGAAAIAAVLVLAMTPIGSALATSGIGASSSGNSSASLSLKYRSVSDSGDCLDYGKGAPCTNCEFTGSMTTSTGTKIDAVCTDVLTASGKTQTWHAYYYFSHSLDSGAVNINETSGTLYAGQSIQFFFGLQSSCASMYNPEIVKIVGPSNSVEIGYSGCG
jgi:hypothetical protein